jgi:hypothetical protein
MRQLANSMELSPSSEAASCPVTEEFPKILYNSKAFFLILKQGHTVRAGWGAVRPPPPPRNPTSTLHS